MRAVGQPPVGPLRPLTEPMGHRRLYLLNCAAIGPVIAPHQSVHLAMVYEVPAATPAGAQTFFWMSESGPFQAATKVWLEVRRG